LILFGLQKFFHIRYYSVVKVQYHRKAMIFAVDRRTMLFTSVKGIGCPSTYIF